MPTRLCSVATCPNPARPGKSRCDEHMREYERERLARRRERVTDARGRSVYRTAIWLNRRKQVLFEEPLCAFGCGRIAEEVDHIVPLSKGGAPYARDNLRGLCRRCHWARHRRALA